MARTIKTGDHIEVLPSCGNAGVEDGEQGVVIDGSNQDSLAVIFPANLHWNGGHGWSVMSREVKLVCRL